MASWPWTSPHHKAWQRLLALLLVLSFAFVPLSSHAAADACQIDCAQLQGEMLDSEEPCGATCVVPPASAQPPIIAPPPLPFMAASAVSDHVPQPPRRPPRT